LVPKAVGIGNPGKKSSTAGNWISPPPPTIESKNPAMNAAPQRNKISILNHGRDGCPESSMPTIEKFNTGRDAYPFASMLAI